MRKAIDNVVHFFWVNDKNGNTLDRVSKLCINSAFLHGHDVNLWTYGNINAPGLYKGVNVCDANQIVDRSEFISQSFEGIKHPFAYFADYFRTILLKKQRGWWSDTDCLFLRNVASLPKDYDYVVGLERIDSKGKEHHAGGMIFLAPGSDDLINYFAEFIKNEIDKTRKTGALAPWGTTCPGIITEVVTNRQNFSANIYSYPRTAFYQAGWKTAELEAYAYTPFKNVQSNYSDFLFDHADDMYVCHLWNALVDFDKVVKDSFFDILLSGTEAGILPTMKMVRLVVESQKDQFNVKDASSKLLNYIAEHTSTAKRYVDELFEHMQKM